MKKLLFFVALTSFMASHPMASTYAEASADRPVTSNKMMYRSVPSPEENVYIHIVEKWRNRQKNSKEGVIYVTAETSLGTISKALSGQSIRYILLGKVSLEFNRTEKTFDGVRDGQWIKNPTDAQALFNQYKTVFDATAEKSISFFSTTMDDWD